MILFKSIFNVFKQISHYFLLPCHILKHLPYFLPILLGTYWTSKNSGAAPISKKRKWQKLNFKTLAFFLLKTYETQSLTLINSQGTLKILYIVELALIFSIWSVYLLFMQIGLRIVRIRFFYQAKHLQMDRLLVGGVCYILHIQKWGA